MASLTSVEKLQKKLDKDPNSLMFTQLAEEYRKDGQLQTALRICQDGLRRHPNYWSARVILGRINHQMGNIHDAKEELEKAVKAVPDNILANKLLGDIYLELNRPEDALTRYKVIQMLTPNDPEARGNIERLESRLKASQEDEAMAAPLAISVAAAETTPPPEFELQQGEEQSAAESEIGETTLPAISAPPKSFDPVTLEIPGDSEPLSFSLDAEPQQPSESQELAFETVGFDAPANQPEETLRWNPPEEKAPQVEPDAAGIAALFIDADNHAPPKKFETNEMPMIDKEESLIFETEEFTMSETKQTDRLESDFTPEPLMILPKPQQPEVIKEAAATSDDVDELTTETLADLYTQQGLIDKAVKVYQKLLLNDPNNLRIIQRLKDLNPVDVLISSSVSNEQEMILRPPDPKSDIQPQDLSLSEERRRKITTLENWLTIIRRERLTHS